MTKTRHDQIDAAERRLAAGRRAETRQGPCEPACRSARAWRARPVDPQRKTGMIPSPGPPPARKGGPPPRDVARAPKARPQLQTPRARPAREAAPSKRTRPPV